MRSFLLWPAMTIGAAAVLAVGILSTAHPQAPFALAATPSPTPGPAVAVPFPLHFMTLPNGVFAGRPLELQVEAQPSAGTTAAYVWDFGDGSSATGASVRHAYPDAGTYTITVTATAGGMQARVQTSVIVTPRPTPLVVELAPGDQASVSFATGGCPPTFYAPNIVPGPNPYLTPSCGCCAPGLATLVNDADVSLGFVYDSATQTVILAAPHGWDVLAIDFPGCVPAHDDALSVLTCPPPLVRFPFSKTLRVDAAPTGSYPTSVTYPAGWNIIAGVRRSSIDGALYTPAADGTFQRMESPTLDQGSLPSAYLAYFSQLVTVPLAPRGPLGGSIQTEPGQWLLLGNPGQVPVSVDGAAAVVALDPTVNSYVVVDVLQPGQGAWVHTGPTGLITLTAEGSSTAP